MDYTYYCTARPAGPGTIPREGLQNIENYSERKQFSFCKAWAKVTYNRALTADEIKDYELHDNKPPLDPFIDFEPLDHIIFFKGTPKEKEAAKKIDKRNTDLLKQFYNLVKDGTLLYCYHETQHTESRKSIFILHQSAKYDCLQYTAVSFENDEFLHMTFDCKIDSFERYQEEAINPKRMYYCET